MKKVLTLMISIIILVCSFGCSKTSDAGQGISNKHYTICISSSVESSENNAIRKGLITGLKDFGLVEDENVTFHYENAKGKEEYANKIAELFVDKKPNVIVSIGNIATKAIKEKTNSIPVVFLAVPNAEELGYSKKDIPTSNLTGVINSLLIDEQYDFINKNYSNIKKLGVIYDSGNEFIKYYTDNLKLYGMSHDIDIYTVAIKKADDIDKALKNILPKVDAVTLTGDELIDSNLEYVVSEIKKAKKEVFGINTIHKNAGAVVAVERDYTLVGEKGAELVKKILIDKQKVKDVKAERVDFKAN